VPTVATRAARAALPGQFRTSLRRALTVAMGCAFGRQKNQRGHGVAGAARPRPSALNPIPV